MNTKKYTEEEARERRNEKQREYARKTGRAAEKKYAEKNAKVYALKVIISKDLDIVEKLSQQENISSYLKSLIRKDIEENGI